MAKSIRDFEGLYGKGELGRREAPRYADGPSFPMMDGDYAGRAGPPADGFQAQTANGTARATGTGWNKDWDMWSEPQVRPDPTRPAGQSNRTGE